MPQEETIIRFPQGLVGFPDQKEFQLFEPTDAYPLKFIQSVEDPDLSFTCMDAAAVKMDYEVPLDESTARTLALEDPKDALVLLLMVVPEDPSQMTADLAGPLVINAKTRIGRQVILNTEQYPLKFPILAAR